MALGADIAGGRIIGHQIAAEVVVGELDFGIATQRVDLARLLAFLRINDDRMLFADRNSWLTWSLRGRGGALVRLGRRRRSRDDRMAIAGAFLAGSRARGRFGRRWSRLGLFRRSAGILHSWFCGRLACH